MTDKQIIDLTEIDQKYKDKCSLIKAGKCKNVNIFIEQSRKLKAKEQECEQLSNAYEACKDSRLKAYNTIDMLEQECEKIKKDNATLFDKAIEARKECTDLKEQLFILKIDYAELEKRHNDSFEQFNQLKAENEELRNILWNVDFNRQSKGKKLIRIEELLKKCATGYTDEFIQEMFSILYELEPVCRYNKLEKYSQTLAEIKEIANYSFDLSTSELLAKLEQILQKISEVGDET